MFYFFLKINSSIIIMAHGFMSFFLVLGTSQKPKIVYSCLMVIKWYGCILVVVMGKVSMIGLGSS
jgi:hypothetical protein